MIYVSLHLPDIVLFAEGLSVSYEAGTIFIKEHLAFGALETGSMPFEVRCYPQDVLIMNLPTTANTKGVFSAWTQDAEGLNYVF